MYMTYLRRELAGRKRQTIIVAAGLAIAIALVMIVNSLAAGVTDAQSDALESMYGVGTDLTISGATAEPGELRPQTFEFGADAGETADDGTTELSQSRLVSEPFRTTIDAGAVDTAVGIDGVAAASGALLLTNMAFSGELPRPEPGDSGTTDMVQPADPNGGFGGGSFGVDTLSVLGVDPSGSAVGPLSAVELTDGQGLEPDDAGERVVVLDATYASTAELGVGDSIELGGEQFEVVGIVGSTSDTADTAANAYIPLDVAQELSGVGDVVSTVYVQAESSDAISAVQEALAEELPDATVSSQSDLASTVSGSLSSAAALISNLGTWLSVIVLVVALALAVLFTLAGVSRRTREFGTLKAIGWSNGRVVGQVAGESVVQGLIGGAVGLVVGLGAILAINLAAPTIPATSMQPVGPGGGSMPAGPGAPGAVLGSPIGQTGSVADIVLQAPVTPWVIAAAVGLALLGGLVAGVFGGWRAARLRPAEALRSVG